MHFFSLIVFFGLIFKYIYISLIYLWFHVCRCSFTYFFLLQHCFNVGACDFTNPNYIFPFFIPCNWFSSLFDIFIIILTLRFGIFLLTIIYLFLVSIVGWHQWSWWLWNNCSCCYYGASGNVCPNLNSMDVSHTSTFMFQEKSMKKMVLSILSFDE